MLHLLNALDELIKLSKFLCWGGDCASLSHERFKGKRFFPRGVAQTGRGVLRKPKGCPPIRTQNENVPSVS
jgi:hypothetical protein